MKFTVLFFTCLLTSPSWAIKQKIQDPKDKREAPLSYGAPSHSTHSFQAPPLGHEDASAVSIGAGYSVGGGKPQYSFGGHGASAALQIPSEELQSSGHAMIQLAPITLQPNHGASGLVSNDLSQLMSQLTHGFNSGAYTLQSPTNFGELYQSAGHNVQAQGGQELNFPQFTYSAPKLQQYTLSSEQSYPGVPSYASGTKGLGSYSSTGPVLFNPEQTHANQQSQNVGSYTTHSLGDGGALPLGASGHPLGGYSLGGSSHALSSPYKAAGGNFGIPSKTSFKPSPYIGSSGHSESSHSVPNAGSYSSPSFGGSFAGYGASLNGLGGSSKLLTSSFVPPKSEGFGSSLEGAAAYISDHSASPGSSAFSHAQSSYAPSTSHAASSHTPQYYISSSKHSLPSSFGESSSYRAPSSSHSALSSYSSPPRYNFGSHISAGSRYGSPKDTQGAFSESTYNTIKYSAELKPYAH